MTERTNRLRIPVDDPEVPTSEDRALPVRAVAQEYAYLGKLVCTCGRAGRIRSQGQALLQGQRGMMDRLDCTCEACGAKYALYFDVSALFEQYGRMFGGPPANDG